MQKGIMTINTAPSDSFMTRLHEKQDDGPSAKSRKALHAPQYTCRKMGRPNKFCRSPMGPFLVTSFLGALNHSLRKSSWPIWTIARPPRHAKLVKGLLASRVHLRADVMCFLLLPRLCTDHCLVSLAGPVLLDISNGISLEAISVSASPPDKELPKIDLPCALAIQLLGRLHKLL